MINAQQVNADITALLKARNTLILVRTDDEARVWSALVSVALAAKFPTVLGWSCSAVGGGFTDPTGRVVENAQDPNAALAFIANRRERAVFILHDLHAWLDPVIRRTLRTMSRTLQAAPPNEARSIILVSPMSAEVPRDIPELTVIDYPLPDREEVASILDGVIGSLREELQASAAPNGTRDRAIDGALGLSALQITNSYSRSLVTSRKIDPALVAGEKKRVIAGIPGVTWYDPEPRGLDAIGGNGELKKWAMQRRVAFSPKARAYGLPAPKGVIVVGPPGTGKSLAAKCLPTAFGVPLLRFDLKATESKYVGESGSNFRRVLQLAETVAPCVLWIDEIEKALGGASGPQGDGGVSGDQLGTLLSWMQENKAPVFVIATANDVNALPPELLRKGRFDELFFVDLPTQGERVEILASALKAHDRPVDGIDLVEVARATADFVGAEIAALVPSALFVAFGDDERAITTADLLAAAAVTVPLAKTSAERISALRAWAKGRARPASSPEATTAGTARALDL